MFHRRNPTSPPPTSRVSSHLFGVRHVLGVASVAGLVCLVGGPLGCGGAAAPAKSGTAEPALQTVEDALVALDDAEAELRWALGGPGADRGSASPPPGIAPQTAPQPYAQPPGQPPPEPVEGTAQAGVDGEREEEARMYAQDSPCAVACRALASMERAAERLCELSGDDDVRCVRAHDRLDQAAARVESSCSSCAP